MSVCNPLKNTYTHVYVLSPPFQQTITQGDGPFKVIVAEEATSCLSSNT